MPTAALRPCAYPGCPQLVKSGRCQQHRQALPDHHREWDRLYSSRRWKMRRRVQLAKEPWCAECLKSGVYVPATIADHLEPHRGNVVKFYTGPLQSLCKSHHDQKTAREVLNG